MFRVRALGLLAAAVFLHACGSYENISGIDPLGISRIDIAPKIDTLFIADSILPKDTLRFDAQIIGLKGQVLTGRLVWKVSDTTVAQVDSFGLVRPRAPGTVEVIARAGEQAKATLVVARAQRRIEIIAARRTILVDDPIDAGDTVTYKAVAYNEANEVVPGVSFTWSSSASGTAHVSEGGLVTAAGLGEATITATNGELTASISTNGELTASIAVTVRPFVQTVTVSAPATRFVAGDTVQFTASATGPNGEALTGRRYRWTSSNPALGTIDEGTGRMVVAGDGTTRITATTGFVDNTPVTDIVVEPRILRSLHAGADFTCGRITLDRAYCWGNDSTFQLGVHADTTCVDAFGGGDHPCSLDPLRLTDAPTFTQIDAGVAHACGLAPDGRAFCWGQGILGQIGDGQLAVREKATLVTSALRFTALTAGENHTCGLLASGQAYCWGYDANGELGNFKKATSTTPIPVEGGHTFTSLSAGSAHTCGIATDGRAWCWGRGASGELGEGASAQRDTAVLVQGGRTYRHISAGVNYTCAVATNGSGYCWGLGSEGRLGLGVPNDANTPQPVAGGLTFRSIEAGETHACGLTTSGTVYCWGTYKLDGLGSQFVGNAPVALGGGLTFASITSGRRHSCGVRDNGDAYCWGSNVWGPFGDGLQALWRPQPVAVKKPQ